MALSATKRRLWQQGVALIALSLLWLVTGSHAGEVLLVDNFDQLTPGDLNGQNGWQSEPSNNVQVQSAIAFSAGQAVRVDEGGLVQRAFTDDAATNVWVDFRAYIDWPEESGGPTLDSRDGGGFYIAQYGVLRVWSNTTWVSTSTVVPEGVWHRFTLHMDYASSSWALYVANDVPNALSVPVATGLPFSPTATNTFLTDLMFEY